ncbi:MAG: ParB N-terminal domain-containing protein [Adlercreutzia equolifaciens]
MYINEKVPIEDVFPLKDEHGNDFARRDYSAKANRDYVARLAESFDKATLQPDEMPVLVQDDGIYYIAAGNSRVEAMRHLGVKFFRAVVLDDTVEEAIEKKLLETAVRTNVKKTYEDGELAEFTRQLLLFGDDQYVSEVTGLDKSRVCRIRRGAPHAGEAVDQMPLEWYEAVGEAEEAGDAETVEALTAASASTWRLALSQVRAKRDAEERKAAILEALAWAGIPVEKGDEDKSGLRYVSSVETAEDVKNREWPDGSVAYMQWDSWAWIYAPKPEADPAEEAAKAERDTARRQWNETCKSRGSGWRETSPKSSRGTSWGCCRTGASCPSTPTT